jgi:F0F1-type ATP synthase assembly protein I
MLLHLTCLNVLFKSDVSAVLCAFATVANNNKNKLRMKSLIIAEAFKMLYLFDMLISRFSLYFKHKAGSFP